MVDAEDDGLAYAETSEFSIEAVNGMVCWIGVVVFEIGRAHV